MKSLGKDLVYEPIDSEEKIFLATEIEMIIFPDSCGYNSYYYANKIGNPYFFVKHNDDIIGITGIYENPLLNEPDTAWLGWYGLMHSNRGKGFGKQILLDTINEAKCRGYDTFRLYTSKTKCKTACKLYDKVMDIGEDYTREQPEMKRVVYSKSLTNEKVVPWGGRDLYLRKDEESEKKALMRYIEIGKKIKKELQDKNIL